MSDATDPRTWDVETLIERDREDHPASWSEMVRRLRRDARLRERLGELRGKLTAYAAAAPLGGRETLISLLDAALLEDE